MAAWSGRPLVTRAGRPKALSVEQAEKLVKAAADELPDDGRALAARILCMRTWSCC